MLHFANYIAAALACAVTLTVGGWRHTLAEGALATAVVELVAVSIFYAAAPDLAAAWHRGRARALFERHSSISAIWPVAVVAWLALILLEAAHTRISEVLS